MDYLYFKYYERHYGGEICEGQENSSWPNHEDEEVEWSLLTCHLNKPEQWPYVSGELKFKITPKLNEELYVLYVRYTTGGSFMITHGVWHIVGVYRNRKKAERTKRMIENDRYSGYTPWKGHFEYLESCEIESMSVQL